MKIIVGLGNPGAKYFLNRHNVGFLVTEALRQAWRAPDFKKEPPFKSLISRFKFEGQDVLLVQPQTYMNLSGEAVQSILSFYKLSPLDLLVIQDDVDLTFSEIRFHIKRGAGGQNGIKSIHQMLGTNEYARLKMGVGRPVDPRHNIADYVLGNFTESQNELEEFISRALDAVQFWIKNGTERAANQYNKSLKKG